MSITAYTVLGVERTATAEEIKAAYRRLAQEHHPDPTGGNGGDERLMVRINKAWHRLGDPEARAAYDRKLAELERQQAAQETSPAEGAGSTFEERLRAAANGDPVANFGLDGLLDQVAAEKVRAVTSKGAEVAKGIADLIGLVRK